MILFLDFDGVLHPINRENGTLTLAAHFEQTIRNFSEVDIVISSAWRQDHTLDELRAYFSEDIRSRIVGVTPILSHLAHSYVRQAEILTWLREVGREYEAWVALDDSDWLFPRGCTNLILVDSELGFNQSTELAMHNKLSKS